MILKCVVGGRDTNSFVTATEADTIIVDQPDDVTEWFDLSDDQKAYRLVLAAQLMGYLPWAGLQIYCGQALCFPRRVRGVVVGYPDAIKQAQVQMAYSVVHRGLANRPDIDEATASNWATSVNIGGLLSLSFGGKPPAGGSILDQITRSAQFPIYLLVKQYLSQVRGGSIAETDDADYPSCSTTTTTSSTSSTSSSTSTSTSSTTA